LVGFGIHGCIGVWVRLTGMISIGGWVCGQAFIFTISLRPAFQASEDP
jgi:hypothetical protein